MALKLLSTKLFVPAPRSNLVSRPRLVATLNASLAVKLTLVSAPAGFGKSTLLSEWAASCGRPVAWLALDEGDNDPMRFMAYFTAALQTINARIGQGTPRPPAIEDAMTELVNEIAHLLGEATPGSPRAARLESGLVLILDDYHAINARPIHEALIPLIDHMPPGMHLVIAARSDPPLPIPRLRARGEMVELRQSDLRFTAEEAAEFLNRVMSLELSAEDVAALASRTEGWIAGLQMAALSMQGSADTQAFIQAFTGSNRYILDYLVEEVLKRQPEPVQRFLLETSILERLCAPLCDAVLSSQVSAVESSPISISPGHLEPLQPRSRSQPILEYLERANLFIVALDDRREWYRYHQLFAEFLRNRLKRDLPGEQPGLHCRAAAWFEKNGFAAEAVEHALNSGDLDYAAQLVDAIAETTLMSSQVTSLMNWIEALPEAAVNARPSLCLHHAWALLLSGYPLDVVEERLEYAASDTERNQGRVEGLRAFVAAFQGNVPLAVELSRKALERMREDDPFLRGVVAWNLGVSSVWSSDIWAGCKALEEAVQVGLQTNNQMVAVVALSHLAELRMNMGELNEAQAQYQRALALAVDSEGRRLPIAGAALIGLGEVLRKRNQLQTALETIQEGLRLTQQWGKIGTLDGYITLARIKQASGDSHSARQEIQKALEIANRFDATQMDDMMVEIFQVQLWVLQKDLKSARRWFDAQGWVKSPDRIQLSWGDGENYLADFYLNILARLALARFHICEGQPRKAIEVVSKWLPIARERAWGDPLIEIQVMLASALWMADEMQPALAALQDVLSLAEPEGYVRVFLDAGEPMAGLLAAFIQQRAAPQALRIYASKLLAALEAEHLTQGSAPGGGGAASAVIGPDWIEPLSEREMEVLGLVAAGLSNREIAGRLVLEVSTVKSHINHIFRKLGVSKRTQAVARARELGLQK